MGASNPLRIELKYIIGALKMLVPVVGTIFLFRVMVMDVSVVDQTSMLPTFRPGDVLIIEKLSGIVSDFHRGDVVQVFNPASDAIQVKRIVGLPGEIVSSSGEQTYVVGPTGEKQKIDEPVAVTSQRAFTSPVLGAQQYYLLGDNRSVSIDSRDWGPASRSQIIGRVAGVWKIGK